LKLRGKNLEFELKKPFDALVNLDYRSNWLGILNTFRTKYYFDIVDLASQINSLKYSFKIA